VAHDLAGGVEERGRPVVVVVVVWWGWGGGVGVLGLGCQALRCDSLSCCGLGGSRPERRFRRFFLTSPM
jgi:hypothetical protein